VKNVTPPEREVLALVARARPTAGSPASWSSRAKTVEAHVRSILAKLDLPSDASEKRLLVPAVQAGWRLSCGS
jgi:DNA-binding NarL/FixJ family response regulator